MSEVARHSSTYAVMKPDWVIIGINQGAEGVLVFGSTSLTHAELEAQIEDVEIYGLFDRPSYIKRYDLRVEMRQFVMTWGKDYAEALRNLFATWGPDGRPLQLGAGQAALEP